MKYFVNTSKDNIKYLNNKQIDNIKILNDNNKITFETNQKSLELLLRDIKELSYFNKRKTKIICFIKKYLISIISIFILILFLINEQFVIKDIKFINDNTYNQEIVDYLYNNKLNKKVIYYYLNDSLSNINNELKQMFYYYEWINITKKGNVLQVIIDKQDERSYLDETSNIKGDIISKYDCIIRYYFIKTGVNLIRDNQSVKKGDVLVSGNLLIHNEKVDYIHPIGIILGEVVTTEIIEVKKEEELFIRTGNIQIEENINIFNIHKKNKIKYNLYEEEIITLFDYNILKKERIIFYEIDKIINYYDLDDAKKYSYSIIEKNFNDNKIHDKEQILETYLLEVYEDNNKFYFKYIIKKILNISEFQAVNLEDK